MDEVLTIKDVAEILKLAEKTVYAMANTGEIPAFKIRGQWRIRRTELDTWLDARPRGGARSAHEPPTGSAGVHRKARPGRKAE